jgi:hypothetical protein
MIEALISISKAETKKLQQMVTKGRTCAPGEDIVTGGSRPGYSILMIEGLSRRDKQMADAPDITALQAPGDFVDLRAQIAHSPSDAARSVYLPAHSLAGDEPVRAAASSASAASLIARSRVVFASRAAR